MEQRNSTSDQSEAATAADLHAELERLFDTLWRCERQWRIDDRFDLMLGNRRR